jgi:hypothetical protein
MNDGPDGPDGTTNLVALRDARARAEALVAHRYGEDLIDADALDRRMDRIARATTMSELEMVIADLVEPGSTPAQVLAATAPMTHALQTVGAGTSVALANPAELPEQRTLTCVFSSYEGPGPGPLARRTAIQCLFGGVELDLRESEFGPGETRLELQVAAGGVEIKVPPGLPVVVDASLILAGVERKGNIPAGPRTPDEPHLRITGFVFVGGIELEERQSGESGGEARRRRRRERKQAKAERKALARGR